MNPPTHSSKVAATISDVWRRHIWLRPLIVLVVLASVGWVMRGKVESTLKANLRSVLQTTLQTEQTALRNWMRMQRNQAEFAAADEHISGTIRTLIANAPPQATSLELLNLSQSAQLRRELDPVLTAQKYNGFIVVEPSGRIVAAFRNELVGRVLPAEQLTPLRDKAFVGKSMMMSPYKSLVVLPDRHGVERARVPTMFTVAPVMSDTGEVIAALGLRIQPEVEFTHILETARIGETGESYAFDRNGLMLSNSRFDDQLRGIGLLPEGEDSTLNVALRDPGVDLSTGARPKASRSELPLTLAASEAAAGREGVNVDGYRDYRGVAVVGAWQWLDDEGFGLTTEVDVSEAHQTLEIIRRAFWSMFGLLGIATLAMLASMLRADRLAEQARLAVIELKRLGQYTLEEKLGEGGMGVVYRAQHAMLHRPTAVKFLDAAKTNEKAIARFEREVQLTAQLNHPNTIAIYDYGRTPEGVFYYAMEYLDGINLEDLVERHGPQPEGRVIHLLKQVCGSLAEAHSIGLIHRDVKPANILLNVRGGQFDVVKLLDFGLVKDTDNAAHATQGGGVVGTPLYMSPEAFKSPDKVDARSDLYAVGAVGYFLLTGTPLFFGDSVLDILNHQVKTAPDPISQRAKQPVSAELEQLLLRCLAKSAADRPASAGELIEALDQVPTAGSWTDSDARKWWRRYIPNLSTVAATNTPNSAEMASTVLVERQEVTT
ncbi:MAG: serine/threonine protein kinase [Planctomycetaceae bacterium]|nr:serine/threonine protein kinase [Planctomycetaceae bacterium]